MSLLGLKFPSNEDIEIVQVEESKLILFFTRVHNKRRRVPYRAIVIVAKKLTIAHLDTVLLLSTLGC